VTRAGFASVVRPGAGDTGPAAIRSVPTLGVDTRMLIAQGIATRKLLALRIHTRLLIALGVDARVLVALRIDTGVLIALCIDTRMLIALRIARPCTGMLSKTCFVTRSIAGATCTAVRTGDLSGEPRLRC
jgi:hypothetical protein